MIQKGRFKMFLGTSRGLMIGSLLFPALAAAADAPMSHSLTWAVLFLIAMPYTIVASVIAWIAYFNWRGNQRRNRHRKQNNFLRLIVTPKEGGR